jgi:hypothetical protein
MKPMRHPTRLMIVLILLVAVGPYATVAADKPDNVPAGGPFEEILAALAAIEETVTDCRDLLTGTAGDLGSDIETLQTTMDANFTDVDASLDAVHADLGDFRAEVGENFTAVTAALDRIEAAPGQGGLRRLHTAPFFVWGEKGIHPSGVMTAIDYRCRNTNRSAPGFVDLTAYTNYGGDGWKVYAAERTDPELAYEEEFGGYISIEYCCSYYVEIIASPDVACTVSYDGPLGGPDCYKPNDFVAEELE